MSHTVTITRTTTTTSATPLFINSGYLKTTPGLLKLAELLLGAVCVGIMGYYWEHGYTYRYNTNTRPDLFFFLITVAFLIGTFCLLASCLFSLSTASIIAKTLYEVIFHALAFLLYLSASLTLLIEVNHRKKDYGRDYEPYLAAAIIGLVVSVLYLLSAFFANKTYRGI